MTVILTDREALPSAIIVLNNEQAYVTELLYMALTPRLSDLGPGQGR